MLAPLSPIFSLFFAPNGKLYLKIQDVLAHDNAHDAIPLRLFANGDQAKTPDIQDSHSRLADDHALRGGE